MHGRHRPGPPCGARLRPLRRLRLLGRDRHEAEAAAPRVGARRLGSTSWIRLTRPLGVVNLRSAKSTVRRERDCARTPRAAPRATRPCSATRREQAPLPGLDARPRTPRRGPSAPRERLRDLVVGLHAVGRRARPAAPRRASGARTRRRDRRPRASSSSAARRARRARCRSGTRRRRRSARASRARARRVAESGSIATGLPAVTHTMRIGGSRRLEDRPAEQRLEDAARRRLAGVAVERRVERAAALEVERDAAARDAEVAADRAPSASSTRTVARAVRPPLHPPPDEDRRRAVAVESRRRASSSSGRGRRRARPVAVERPRERERAERVEVIAVGGRLRGRSVPSRTGAARCRARARCRRRAAAARRGRARSAPRWRTGSISDDPRSRARVASWITGSTWTLLTCGFFPHSTIVLRVQEVEEVVAVLLAEVGELRRVPRPRADVAALDRARGRTARRSGR